MINTMINTMTLCRGLGLALLWISVATAQDRAIKLTGKVPSEPPYKGFLRHKGWRATKVHFPTRSGKIDPTVVQAAEVEFI